MADFPVCLEGERLAFLAEYVAHDMLPGGVHMSRPEDVGSSWDGASIPRWAVAQQQKRHGWSTADFC